MGLTKTSSLLGKLGRSAVNQIYTDMFGQQHNSSFQGAVALTVGSVIRGTILNDVIFIGCCTTDHTVSAMAPSLMLNSQTKLPSFEMIWRLSCDFIPNDFLRLFFLLF